MQNEVSINAKYRKWLSEKNNQTKKKNRIVGPFGESFKVSAV